MSAAGELAERAERYELTVAVAESLTAGNIAASLGAEEHSAVWFRGGIVAYTTEVKQRVLGVPDVPVVSEAAAVAMAKGVRSLMEADLAVGVTGVGGPGPQEGEPPGSVWFALATRRGTVASHRRFDGGPQQVVDQTVQHAVELLLAAIEAPD
ncbi:CinA family protein [Nocardia sp. CA-119907]|uniref:CinA family protein n=1 Tax=Nocardia sp. CA-119907 TaxID=3239973 RepID=UPI003D953C75